MLVKIVSPLWQLLHTHTVWIAGQRDGQGTTSFPIKAIYQFNTRLPGATLPDLPTRPYVHACGYPYSPLLFHSVPFLCCSMRALITPKIEISCALAKSKVKHWSNKCFEFEIRIPFEIDFDPIVEPSESESESKLNQLRANSCNLL